jgi:hypothetical protein
MEPGTIDAAQWDQISRALIYLFLFTGLGLTSAIAFLFGGGVLPSLIESRDIAAFLNVLRWMTYPVAATAGVLAAYALIRGLLIAILVAQELYPRGWI